MSNSMPRIAPGFQGRKRVARSQRGPRSIFRGKRDKFPRRYEEKTRGREGAAVLRPYKGIAKSGRDEWKSAQAGLPVPQRRDYFLRWARRRTLGLRLRR